MTVDELFGQVLPRLNDKPQCSIIDAVRRANTIICNRLAVKRSTLLRENATATIAAGDESFPIRAAGGRVFLSVAGEPYYTDAGKRKYIKPFDAALAIPDTAAAPRYYERVGRRINVYPTADAEYTITIPVNAVPVAPAEMTEDIPFDGLFDDAYLEAVYGVMLNGTSAVADRAFVAGIETQVDMVMAAQEMADEQALVDSLNYRG